MKDNMRGRVTLMKQLESSALVVEKKIVKKNSQYREQSKRKVAVWESFSTYFINWMGNCRTY